MQFCLIEERSLNWQKFCQKSCTDTPPPFRTFRFICQLVLDGFPYHIYVWKSYNLCNPEERFRRARFKLERQWSSCPRCPRDGETARQDGDVDDNDDDDDGDDNDYMQIIRTPHPSVVIEIYQVGASLNTTMEYCLYMLVIMISWQTQKPNNIYERWRRCLDGEKDGRW